MSNESNVYRELQQHLDKLPIGFPATESGVEIRILKQLFTPEEAKAATKLGFDLKPLEEIYTSVDNTEMSITDLELLLDSSVSKGAIHSKKEGNKKYYANSLYMIGMYDMQFHKGKEFSMEFKENASQYWKEGMTEELFRTGIHQLRVIPIEKSISQEHNIASYDDVRKIIENKEGPIVVAMCVCRHKKEAVGEPCSKTNLIESCFVLHDDYVHTYIEQGWGRIVTKEEALEILRKTGEDGLVYQPGKAQRPGSICCCCGCCCGYLADMKDFPHLLDIIPRNYYAEIDSELCTGCGTCIDRCNMDALTLIDEKSTIDLIRCIGCGVCVPTCPSDAMHLLKKEKDTIPPKDWDSLYAAIWEKKKELTS